MTSRLMVLSSGRGKERKVNGSNLTLVWWHSLHSKTDLSCRKETRMDSLERQTVLKVAPLLSMVSLSLSLSH